MRQTANFGEGLSAGWPGTVYTSVTSARIQCKITRTSRNWRIDEFEAILEHLTNRHQFSDFAVFAETLGRYNLEIKQLEGGSFNAFTQQIFSPTVFIHQVSTSLRVEAAGSPPPDLRTFGIPTVRCQPFVCRDRHSDAKTIQVFRPETELSVITNSKFEAIDVSISEGGLNALNHMWGYPDLDDIVANREMVICDPVKLRRLQDALNYVSVSVYRHRQRLQSDLELQELIRYQIPFLLVDALMTSSVPKVRNTAESRDRALSSAIDYIQSLPGEAVTVEDICLDIGINKRTLQRAFMEKYNVTPKQYLQVQRLNSVYRTLLRSDPTATKIRDVAIDEGYWHMSQFAADYRRLFGELPSTTLNRSGKIGDSFV
ncbi:MAG: helix-turn-helix domain-containing protein [Gammaproteobacteria bacterium]|nr:helix-turn-helix domain-containing protein [Gammaproteobacteria bacterium]